MPIRVALHHRTIYHYDRLVGLSPQTIRLRPAPHCRTPITAYSLKVEPKPHFLNWQQDPQSNFLARVVFPRPVVFFSVDVDLIAEMTVINPFDFFLEPYAEKYPFCYEPALEQELAPFRQVRPAGPKLAAYLKTVNLSERRSIDFLVELNQQLQHKIGYSIRMEPGVQSSEETLALEKRIVPGHRLGAGRNPAAFGTRRALRLRLFDPVEAGCKTARRTARALPKILPICMHGRRCTSRAPGGWVSIPPRDCWPAKATSRSRPRPNLLPPRPSPAPWIHAKSSSRTRCR